MQPAPVSGRRGQPRGRGRAEHGRGRPPRGRGAGRRGGSTYPRRISPPRWGSTCCCCCCGGGCRPRIPWAEPSGRAPLMERGRFRLLLLLLLPQRGRCSAAAAPAAPSLGSPRPGGPDGARAEGMGGVGRGARRSPPPTLRPSSPARRGDGRRSPQLPSAPELWRGARWSSRCGPADAAAPRSPQPRPPPAAAAAPVTAAEGLALPRPPHRLSGARRACAARTASFPPPAPLPSPCRAAARGARGREARGRRPLHPPPPLHSTGRETAAEERPGSCQRPGGCGTGGGTEVKMEPSRQEAKIYEALGRPACVRHRII